MAGHGVAGAVLGVPEGTAVIWGLMERGALNGARVRVGWGQGRCWVSVGLG